MAVRYFNLRLGERGEINAGIAQVYVSPDGLENSVNLNRNDLIHPHDYDWVIRKNEKDCSFLFKLVLFNLPTLPIQSYGDGLVTLKLNPDGKMEIYDSSNYNGILDLWEISEYRASEIGYAGNWELEKLLVAPSTKH